MKLSIVIPVYNAERYIEECVSSLKGLPHFFTYQDNDIDLEVLLIDDGSVDKSSELCDAIRNKNVDFEIKVFHQHNLGVSVARNVGIEQATGEWVWFVDADDKIAVPSRRYSLPEKAKLGIVGYSWNEKGLNREYGASPEEIPYNLWRCLFNRDILLSNNIRFVKGRKYAEDQEFVWNYLLSSRCVRKSCAQVFAINYPMYIYNLRQGSAMTRKGVKAKKMKDIFKVNISFLIKALLSGDIISMWVWKELKRMTKTLLVICVK